MNNKIAVSDLNGQLTDINLLEVFEIDGYDHQYALYSKGEKMPDNPNKEKGYVSIINQHEQGYTFDNIEDDKEWEDVQAAITKYGYRKELERALKKHA